MKPKKNQKTSDVKIATTKRRNTVMRMRLAGLTYNNIISRIQEWADREGIVLPKNYDERKAFIDVDRELKKVSTDNAELREQLFNLENERIDILQAALWQDAAKGNEKKVDRILKIMDRRAKYWGLDAPTENKLSGDFNVNFEQLRDLLRDDELEG